MGAIFSPPKAPQMPPPPPPVEPLAVQPVQEPAKTEEKPIPAVPNQVDPDVVKARQSERSKAAQRQGRAATVLTGGSGINEPANTAKKTALGA